MRLDIAFYETSALQGTNIDKIFDLMIKDVYDKCHKEFEEVIGIDLGEGNNINLNQNGLEEAENENKCCGK